MHCKPENKSVPRFLLISSTPKVSRVYALIMLMRILFLHQIQMILILPLSLLLLVFRQCLGKGTVAGPTNQPTKWTIALIQFDFALVMHSTYAQTTFDFPQIDENLAPNRNASDQCIWLVFVCNTHLPFIFNCHLTFLEMMRFICSRNTSCGKRQTCKTKVQYSGGNCCPEFLLSHLNCVPLFVYCD